MTFSAALGLGKSGDTWLATKSEGQTSSRCAQTHLARPSGVPISDRHLCEHPRRLIARGGPCAATRRSNGNKTTMETIRAGGHHSVFASDKIQGLGEVAVGGAMGTGYLWMPLLDNIQLGLHFYTSLAGAALVTHGIWRVIRGRRGR